MKTRHEMIHYEDKAWKFVTQVEFTKNEKRHKFTVKTEKEKPDFKEYRIMVGYKLAMIEKIEKGG